MNEIQFVDSVAELQDLCQKMKLEPWLIQSFCEKKPIIQSFACYKLRHLNGLPVSTPLRWRDSLMNYLPLSMTRKLSRFYILVDKM